MRIDLPDPSLVVLIGASGSGKSSFARKHFAPTEVISSDFCRGLVADDENDQSATTDAFAVLHFIAGRRLAQPRFTVVDATNVQREARRPLIELAKQHDLFPVAIVLDLPEAVCQERNRSRPDRDFGPHVVRQQRSQLHKSLKGLQREGFRRVCGAALARGGRRPPRCSARRCGPTAAPSTGRSTSSATSTAATRELARAAARARLRASTRRHHGDAARRAPGGVRRRLRRPRAGHAGRAEAGDVDGRRPAPRSACPATTTSSSSASSRAATCRSPTASVKRSSSSKASPRSSAIRPATSSTGSSATSCSTTGKLVVAHAGMKEAYQGRSSGRVRDFALFGETTGETDEFGLPGAAAVGGRLPRQGRGRLRAHPGRASRSG